MSKLIAWQSDVVWDQIHSDSCIQAYGVDCMEPGGRTRSNNPTLRLLRQGRVFRCWPATEECSQKSQLCCGIFLGTNQILR